jgi:hypothetical protein
MPTEELENELRRVLARAAADIPDPEQARQRLPQRKYRPGRGHRRLAAGITSAAAAAAVVLGLGLSGAFGSAPARGTGTIRTAAFTLAEHANGTATLTINLFELVDAAALQNALQQDGIPALVTSGSFCSSHPALASFSQVVSSPGRVEPGDHRPPLTITINPAAMPEGTELSLGVFQLGPDERQADFELINTSSYSCTSTPPSPHPDHGTFIFLQVGGPAGS